ncbi:hypothetical protein QYQ98_07530 [Corynebacterium sp. P3-F1]|nr:hypothetical protein [Corynebacterium sp. P3-F1]WKK60882.1 hypothetical protein QYQ98_07530 [Corynebacterium sp. P3-F1]
MANLTLGAVEENAEKQGDLFVRMHRHASAVIQVTVSEREA